MVSLYAQYKRVTFIGAMYILPKICICGTAFLFLMNLYWFTAIFNKFLKSITTLLKGKKLS